MEKEQQKARFFGMHIGMPLYYSGGVKSENLGVDVKSARILLKDLDIGFTWWPIRHCKLILKPLIEITDEDAIEVSKIIGYGSLPDSLKIKKAKEWFGDIFGIGKVSHKWDALHAFDFLRSRGYCVPFMDINNPVSEGWAIIEEKQ